MKKIGTLFLFFILRQSQGIAQDNLQLTRMDYSCDSFVVITKVFFNFGSMNQCPALGNYTISSDKDTMFLKLYYHMGISYPDAFCERADVITSHIIRNTTILKVMAFRRTYNADTTFRSSAMIPLCNPLSFDENLDKEHYNIYPNPFSSEINVITNRQQNSTFILFDFLGKEILRKAFYNSISINTEEFSSGIYTYQILNMNGIYQKGKVVKN